MKKILKILCAIIFFNIYLVVRTHSITLRANDFYSQGQTTDWTFFIYMDASYNLGEQALYNLNEMMEGVVSSTHLKVVVQLHGWGECAWRYEVNHKKLDLVMTVTLGDNCKKDFCDGMGWALLNYPAKHNAIVLWNHGHGVLDPDDEQRSIMSNNWEYTYGLYPLALFKCSRHDTLKGILFNGVTRGYLNNSDLIDSLDFVYKILGGKIDILGADACMMSMLEIGYHVRKYVNFLVGSENCELPTGWDYRNLFKKICVKYYTPLEVSSLVIETFRDFYSKNKNNNMYTHSLCNLNTLDNFIKNLNSFVDLSCLCVNKYKDKFKDIVLKVRTQGVQFCGQPLYTDIIYFYTLLCESLCACEIKDTPEIKELCKILHQGLDLFNTLVIANVAGAEIFGARGLSIYFPYLRVSESYRNIPFVRETKWVKFLQEVIGCV
jgi:hypothetical protein